MKLIIKKVNVVLLSLAVLLVTVSCSDNEPMLFEKIEGNSVFLYDTESEVLVSVEYEGLEELQEESEDYILFLLQTLKDGVEGSKYQPTLSQDVGIIHVASYNGNVIVNFDRNYYNMDPIQEMYARASIVRTLTQSGEYGSVELFVDNEILTDYNGEALGRQYNSSVMISYDETIDRNEKHWVTVYLPNEAKDKLVEKFVSVTVTPNKKIEEIVIEQLMVVGSNGIIPVDVELLNVYTHEGICFVDFSSEIQTTPLPVGVSERIAVYSIVNTLVELEHISSVQILVNGGVVSTFQNHLSLNRLFTKNHALIDQE